MYRIGLLNKIFPDALKERGKHVCVEGTDKGVDALLVRSAVVDTAQYPNLLAVARVARVFGLWHS